MPYKSSYHRVAGTEDGIRAGSPVGAEDEARVAAAAEAAGAVAALSVHARVALACREEKNVKVIPFVRIY